MLIAATLFPFASTIIFDLNLDASFTNSAAGRACKPTSSLITTSISFIHIPPESKLLGCNLMAITVNSAGPLPAVLFTKQSHIPHKLLFVTVNACYSYSSNSRLAV